MIMKIRKMLLCFLAIQILFITFSAISYAATCSNNWRSPSSQTMETEIMSASMTEYANIERYLSIKQGWKTTHIYFLQGVLLVKGLDDDEINYDNIFWYPMMFMQSGVLSKAFPQGPCSITQKTPMALTEAEGEVVPKSQGVIEYDYTLKGKQNVKHFKGIMKFTPKEAAPPDDTVVKGFKIVDRFKPYTVIGSKDMPVTTIKEFRNAMAARAAAEKKDHQDQASEKAKSDAAKNILRIPDTMKPEDIIMAPKKTLNSEDRKELYPLIIGNLWGYVNKAGYVVIEPRFNLAFFFEGCLAKVHINHQWGVIDNTGRFIIEPQYQAIGRFQDGLASVLKNEKVGFINEKGEIIVTIEGNYQTMPEFKNGVAFFLKNDKSFFIDKNGRYITEDQFCEAVPCYRRKTPHPMQKDKKWGLVNAKNEFILKPQYDHINDEKEGLFLVKKNDLYGFIDQTGNLVINLQFEHADDFKDGLAGVKKNGKYGFIDKMGRFVIEPQFDSVRPFEDEIAAVMMNRKWGLVDKTGNYFVKPQFENVSFSHGAGSGLQKNGKWNIIDRTGKIIIEYQFDGVPPFSEREFAVVHNGLESGVINKSGKIIIPVQYSTIIEYPNPAHPNTPNVFAVKQVFKYPNKDHTDSTGNIFVVMKGYTDTAGNIFVMTDKVCGQDVVKNGKGEITWPKNIKELCGQKN